MKHLILPLAMVIAGSCGGAAPAQTAPAPTTTPLPEPVTDGDFHREGRFPTAQVELGRLLFFDKLLSGNRNISCATCHHPRHATGDGVALAFGEGARGLGPGRRPLATRRGAVHERVPRNAPALFNLGAREYTRMFHDGRVELDTAGFYAAGFITPARFKLPVGLDNLLAAQAMFPVTSPTEMAGQQGENEIADARAANRVAGPGGVWDRLARRLRAIPEYVRRFRKAFPTRIAAAADITFVDAANAIAAFEATAFRADRSPFDDHLRGGRRLVGDARAGMELFYGRARCATCHAGKFQTDHEFHAIAMPQIGPGKADGRDPGYWRATGIPAFLEDFGRGRVTMRDRDRFAFRTPSLRNVALTGPWGHAGAFATLAAIVRHHAAPVRSLHAFQLDATALPPMPHALEVSASGDELMHTFMPRDRLVRYLRRDTWVQSQPTLRDRIAAANELEGIALDEREIAQLVAFLHSLTDPAAGELAALIPARVPSGLPVED